MGILLACIARTAAKHLGNFLTFGLAGDILTDAWDAWQGQTNEASRKKEAERLANATPEEVRAEAKEASKEAGGLTPEERCRLEDCLVNIPPSIRRGLRSPADPSGKTLPPGRRLNRAEDLRVLLPLAASRFKVGDRPLSGVDWELEELLGVGGTGEVWKAVNPHLRRERVALKFCTDPDARERLLTHEARVLAQLQANGRLPGIVPLLRTYLSADPPCLEFEYVEGGDLAATIREWHAAGSPDPEAVAGHVRDLAAIIGQAHRLSPPVVHRDIKPANILAQRTAAGYRLVVADFGIGGVARHAADQTRRGAFAGALGATIAGSYTPHYASPQQVAGGDDASPSDDVYSLGVVWHQMLTGDLSRGAPTGDAWKAKLAARGMSAGLVSLLTSTLEHEREDRPADGVVLAERLVALLAAPPSPASPLPAPMSATEGGVLEGRAQEPPSLGDIRTDNRSDVSVQFHRHVLANGLQIIGERAPSARSVALGFFVRTGSRDETPDILGISHLLHLTAFKGSDRRTAEQISSDFGRIGADYNAFTSEESTVYHATVLPEYLPEAVDILSDLLMPSLHADDIEMEKRIALNVIGRYEDMPQWDVFDRAKQAHFAGHPLGYRILGTPASVTSLSRDQVRAYHRRRYVASNITLAVAGHFAWEQVLELAQTHCGGWEGGSAGRQLAGEVRGSGAFTAVEKPLAPQEYVVLVSAGPPARSELRYAADILSVAAGDDAGSRLYWELIDPGLTDSAGCSYQDYEDVGAFYTSFSCEPGRAQTNLANVSDLLRTLWREGLTEDEMETAKGKVLSRLARNGERPRGRLMALGNSWLCQGGYRSVDDALRSYEKVTRADILRVTERYPFERFTAVALGPLTGLSRC